MQIPQLKNKNIDGLFDKDMAIEEAVWSNDDVDENGRGFIFPDSDLHKPIEQPPQFISNDTDQYPRIGLKPALHGKIGRPSKASL